MPHAIKIDKKYRKKGLTVVLTHVQEETVDLAAFMMKRFPTNTAMVTADNPLVIGKSDALKLPMAALVGVDGKIIAVGHRNEVGKLIDKRIPIELKKLQTGWGAAPEIASARALMHGKGLLFDAKKILETYQPSTEEVKADLELAKKELKLRFKADVASIKYMMATGSWIEAKKNLEALTKGCKGEPTWEATCAAFKAKFDDYVGKNELKLDKAVTKLIIASQKGVKDGMDLKMRKVVGKMTGLKVSKRAMWYANVWSRMK
ncbi:MAG: hypothetical protein ACI97A_000492 [Planctomycetota bacterium]